MSKNMVEHESKKPESDKNGVIIPEPFKKTRVPRPSLFRTKKQRLLATGVTLLIIVIAGVGVWANTSKPAKSTADKSTKVVQKQISDAHDLIRNGDNAAATLKLQDAEKNATTADEKAEAELGIAEIAANSGDYDGAIKHAQAANKLKESARNFAMIGYAASNKKDWRLAADSYAKAAELSKTGDSFGQNEYTNYKNMEIDARSNL